MLLKCTEKDGGEKEDERVAPASSRVSESDHLVIAAGIEAAGGGEINWCVCISGTPL